MIKLIGRKRFLILVVVAMINIILAAFLFLWINPSSQDAEMQLNSLTAQISTLQNDITTVKDQIQRTRDNIPYFEQLKQIGFFDSQDRFEAERVIQRIQARSGIQKASFAIDELQDVRDDLATQAKYRLVRSNIEISNFNSYDDLEVYKLIFYMNNNFPGHTRLTELTMSRPLDITVQDLQEINDPEKNKFFVKGSANFEWYTMIEDEQGDIPGIEGGF